MFFELFAAWLKLKLTLNGLSTAINHYHLCFEFHIIEIIIPLLSPQEAITYDFECHYRNEQWQTGHYFHFVEDFLKTARLNRDLPEECDPPPCPTATMDTTIITQYPTSGKCWSVFKCKCSYIIVAFAHIQIVVNADMVIGVSSVLILLSRLKYNVVVIICQN